MQRERAQLRQRKSQRALCRDVRKRRPLRAQRRCERAEHGPIREVAQVQRHLGIEIRDVEHRNRLGTGLRVLVRADPRALALHGAGLAHDAAMRAHRTMRPTRLFEVGAGLVGVSENGVGQVHAPKLRSETCFVKYITAHLRANLREFCQS